MKTQLTNEQTLHLLDLGIPKALATGIDYSNPALSNIQRTFTLTDILEILPKKIEQEWENGKLIEELRFYWCSRTKDWGVKYTCNRVFQEDELIDALYELLCWTIENKYIKI